MKLMQKLMAMTLALCMVLGGAFAEDTQVTPPPMPEGQNGQMPSDGSTPPAMPEGQSGQMPSDGTTPPAKPDGQNGQDFGGQMPSDGSTPPAMPEGQSGQMPSDGSTPPDGQNGQGVGGMGGGMSSQPESYTAVQTIAEDTTLTDVTFASLGTDENALLVTDGNVNLSNVTVTRESADSTGGDNASFYGVGAAILATGGTLTIQHADITTDAAGGAGVFAYGNSVVNISDATISTGKDTSGGIHVAGGGTLNASNLNVTTEGNSSAAIRSDRGGGTMTVNGGSYTSNGTGSPAIYVTADITVTDAELTATNSEALCLEGLNNVSLTNCTLSGAMHDDAQNDNTWTVILYQSMSGDAQVGKGSFVMDGGKLASANGGLFYTTNTESEFTLKNVTIEAAEDCEYFLRCTGNSNQRGWGNSGNNGAVCSFTAIQQQMQGDVQWDSISTLNLALTEGSVLEGAIVDDESCAGNGGSGTCTVVLDESSTWIVTGNSTVSTLEADGTIRDAEGNSVSILNAKGEVLVSGNSTYTITVLN